MLNEVNQDMQKEFNEGFDGMENSDEAVDDYLRDMQLRV